MTEFKERECMTCKKTRMIELYRQTCSQCLNKRSNKIKKAYDRKLTKELMRISF